MAIYFRVVKNYFQSVIIINHALKMTIEDCSVTDAKYVPQGL